MGHLGERVEAAFTWDTGLSCSGGAAATVTRATVELVDPDNAPVHAEALLPLRRVQAGVERWEATVVFTPKKLGPHYAIVTFEPEGGLAQGPVWVVADRRGEAPALTARTPGATCSRLEPLPSGSLVCEQPQGGVLLFRGDARVAEWPNASYRAAGGSLWLSLTPWQLARAAEAADGGLLQVDRDTSSFGAFAATADEALLWVGRGLERIGFDGSGLRFDGRLDTPSLEVRALAWAPQALTVVAATQDRWSRFSAEAGAADAGLEWTSGEGAVHQAPDGLWLESAFGGALRFAPADARLPLVDAPVPFAWQHVRGAGEVQPGERPLVFPSRLLSAADAFPSLDRAEVLVPELSAGALAWQHFRAPPGTTFAEVSGGWLRATDGERHHFFRAAP